MTANFKDLADELEKLCCAETEGKFFDCVTDNITSILEGLRKANAETDAVAQGECQPPAIFADPIIPTDMVLVPREPTTAQVMAGYRASDENLSATMIKQIYDAMLSSSPSMRGSEKT